MKLYQNEIEDIEEYIYMLQMHNVSGLPDPVPVPRAMLLLMCEAVLEWLKSK